MSKHEVPITKDFCATRRFPVRVGGWEVWKEGSEIFCRYILGRREIYKSSVKFQEGVVYLVKGKGTTYCYTRDKKFLEIQKRFGITKVVNLDPNQCYITEDIKSPRGFNKKEIKTDGKVHIVSLKGMVGKCERNEGKPCLCDSHRETVTEATWVLETTTSLKGGIRFHQVILYTTEKLKDLDLTKCI